MNDSSDLAHGPAGIEIAEFLDMAGQIHRKIRISFLALNFFIFPILLSAAAPDPHLPLYFEKNSEKTYVPEWGTNGTQVKFGLTAYDSQNLTIFQSNGHYYVHIPGESYLDDDKLFEIPNSNLNIQAFKQSEAQSEAYAAAIKKEDELRKRQIENIQARFGTNSFVPLEQSLIAETWQEFDVRKIQLQMQYDISQYPWDDPGGHLARVNPFNGNLERMNGEILVTNFAQLTADPSQSWKAIYPPENKKLRAEIRAQILGGKLKPAESTPAPSPVAETPEAQLGKMMVRIDELKQKEMYAGIRGKKAIETDAAVLNARKALAESFDAYFKDFDPSIPGQLTYERLRAFRSGTGDEQKLLKSEKETEASAQQQILQSQPELDAALKLRDQDSADLLARTKRYDEWRKAKIDYYRQNPPALEDNPQALNAEKLAARDINDISNRDLIIRRVRERMAVHQRFIDQASARIDEAKQKIESVKAQMSKTQLEIDRMNLLDRTFKEFEKSASANAGAAQKTASLEQNLAREKTEAEKSEQIARNIRDHAFSDIDRWAEPIRAGKERYYRNRHQTKPGLTVEESAKQDTDELVAKTRAPIEKDYQSALARIDSKTHQIENDLAKSYAKMASLANPVQQNALTFKSEFSKLESNYAEAHPSVTEPEASVKANDDDSCPNTAVVGIGLKSSELDQILQSK